MSHREPDFDRLLKVLRREPTDSPVLFEMILNERLARRFNDGSSLKEDTRFLAHNPWWGTTFTNLGYDYWMGYSCPITFNEPNREREASIGMAHGGVIASRADFEALGTGNSVPEYIPDENYLAMINAARTSNKPLWGFDPRPSDTWVNPLCTSRRGGRGLFRSWC